MEYRSLILVVDDQPWGRAALASLLEPEGLRLAFAANGPAALAMARTLRPDLVLLDVMLPLLDGFEVCRLLRADLRTAALPVILVTALDDQQSLLRGLEAGADDFIAKPFNRAELRARVRTIARLNRYRRLWEERQRYAQLVECSPNGVLVVDLQGSIRLANPALHRLLAVAPEAPLPVRLLELVAPDRRAEATSWFAALAGHQAQQPQLETVLLAADGSRRPVELVAGACTWDSGPALQILVGDTTERKRAELLEEERYHLAHELHDGVGQLAVSLYQQLQAFERGYRTRAAARRVALGRIVGTAQRVVAETRRLLAGLRPTALDDFGLVGALRLLCDALRAEGWTITLDVQLGSERLPPPVELALFRVAQEALANTQKHAGELRAALSLAHAGNEVRLAVCDWGRGFDPAALAPAAGVGEQLGLRGMRERIAILGGELQLAARPGAGTRILARVPLPVPCPGRAHCGRLDPGHVELWSGGIVEL